MEGHGLQIRDIGYVDMLNRMKEIQRLSEEDKITFVRIIDAIVEKILTIQQLPQKDKDHILFALKALLRDAKARATYSK